MNEQSQQQPQKGVTLFSIVMSKLNKLSMKILIIILSAVSAIILFCGIYFSLFSFSIHNTGLRWTVVLFLIIWSIPFVKIFFGKKSITGSNKLAFKQTKLGWSIPLFLAAIVLLISLGLSLFSSPLFIAKKYHNDLITVNENVNFEDDVENYDKMLVSQIDKDTAKKLGSTLLSEGTYGSQFTISDYTMIHYQNDLYWIGALEYIDFFKWYSNRKTGSPGYILISATNPDKKNIVLKSFKYTPSAYFGQDLERKMYLSHMTMLRDTLLNFELDEEGNPFYIQAVYKNKFALSSGADSLGVIVLNAIDGTSKYYANGTEPSWIDRVQPQQLVSQQLNYWGKYKLGFFNTLFSKKETMQVTSGYNYIFNKGNFVLYTGMTSTGSDESLIGMILSDLTTKETKFYRASGATEYMAQKSAEGAFQDQGYRASFPTLINFDGLQTYFMTMKDNNSLVKQYVYINIKEFEKVCKGDTPQQAQEVYRKTFNLEQDTPPPVFPDETHTLTVMEISQAIINGNTVYYIMFSDADFNEFIYKADIRISDQLPFIAKADKVDVKISDKNIVSIKKN